MGATGSDAKLMDELQDKSFRDTYVAEHVRAGVAHQITTLREQRGWSQAQLGEWAGKTQSVISRLENPDYGKASLQSLLEIASAFDVALSVRFVSFGELVALTGDVTRQALEVPSYSRAEPSYVVSPPGWVWQRNDKPRRSTAISGGARSYALLYEGDYSVVGRPRPFNVKPVDAWPEAGMRQAGNKRVFNKGSSPQISLVEPKPEDAYS